MRLDLPIQPFFGAATLSLPIPPALGWWDQPRELRESRLRFSLIVTVQGPGVYAAIRPRVEVPVEALVTA